MNLLFPFMDKTPSLIVLLDNGALMYDTKDCNPMQKAVGCNECHTSKHPKPTVLANSASINEKV